MICSGLVATQKTLCSLMEAYRDHWGLAFDEHRKWLPPRVADWPAPPTIKVDKAKEQAIFHQEFAGKPCWLCEIRPGKELHHLFAGYSRGRSHERFLFTWLCKDCHENHVGTDNLGRLLYAKWYRDRDGCDWVRMALRAGRHLPDLDLPGN